MPYISKAARVTLAARVPASPGELNYLITKMVMAYLESRGELNYTGIAEVTGVLENVKQEFYRRVAVPFEDQKCRENGDVF